MALATALVARDAASSKTAMVAASVPRVRRGMAAAEELRARIAMRREERYEGFATLGPPAQQLSPRRALKGPRRLRDVGPGAYGDTGSPDDQVTRAIGSSPIGLYPVYETSRFVAGTFVGTVVAAPSSLRYALSEARHSAPFAKSDGGFLEEGTTENHDDDVVYEEE
mmetsp:Transcript_64444/g.179258  ORF Transcript_64444/g.179258 Transcript_64444/m.179258 type:complete len:167 (-) Transcript_64444:81-581(-)